MQGNKHIGQSQDPGITAAKLVNTNVGWLDKIIRILDKVGTFSRWTNVVGIALLLPMVLLTFMDVVMRYLLNKPIFGVTEVTEVMLISAVYLAVAHTQNEKAHVSVDLITSKLAPKARIVLEFITTLLGAGLFVIVAWRTLLQAIYRQQEHIMHSQVLMIPSTPFAAFIFIGCSALCLILIRDLLRNVAEAIRLGSRWYHWLLMIGVPILFVFLAILWLQPTLWQISLPVIGVIGLIVSFILFLSGMPIAFVMVMVGFLFMGHIRGPYTAFQVVGVEFYRTVGSWVWAVAAFFIIMGFFVLYAKLGEDLYLTGYRWVGRMRGGLAVATVAASTGMAATVGDPISVTATMTAVSLPEMRKYNYGDRLSAGSIMGGATLGPVIPPSVTFIVYGILTGIPIGALFIGGIIPGLFLAIAFVFAIYISCRFNPALGPRGESSTWGQKLVSTKAGGPVLLLFLIVITGIYTGIFTPSEGGAVGAVGVVIIGLLMRRWTLRRLIGSLRDAGKIVAMTFLMLVGATIFTRFTAWSNISTTFSELITGANLSPLTIVVIIELLFFVLGFVCDILPLILIGIPIVHPIVVAVGIDPVWFALVTCIVVNLGALTPPIGIILFTFKGMAKDIPMSTIYLGALPFVFATVVVIAIMFAVPSLFTWLPGLMK